MNQEIIRLNVTVNKKNRAPLQDLLEEISKLASGTLELKHIAIANTTRELVRKALETINSQDFLISIA